MKLSERAKLIQSGLASPEHLEGLSNDDLIAIKSDQSEVHYRFLAGTHAVDCISRAGHSDKKKPRFRHVASDESVDAVGDIIRVAGWDTKRFESNPVLLWAHDQRALPLGLVERVWKSRAGGSPALMTESEFHDEDLNPMAAMVMRLVEAGALPGVSVGFIPKEFVFPDSSKDRAKLGLGEWGVLHVKQELVELSVVPVPANGNALQKRSIELAEPIFAEESWEKDMVETCRRYFNLETPEQETLRKRMIFFTGEGEARAEKIDEEPETKAPEPLPGNAGEAPKEPLSIALDERSITAIETLHEAVETLVERLTKASTVAAGEPKGDDPPNDPAGPGEAFMAGVLKEIEALDLSKG